MPEQEFSKDTSSRTAKDWAQGLLVLLAGLIIAHLGVTLFLLSGMGTDTFTVFIQGLAVRTGFFFFFFNFAVLILFMLVVVFS